MLVTAALWLLALVADPAAAVIELAVTLGAGLAAAHFGRPWWYENHRTEIRDHESPAQDAAEPASTGGGFTQSVRHSFHHYFSLRVPREFAPREWLDHTAEIRDSLAAEIALLYRESRVTVDRVNWLIRYLAEDARNRHNNGTLFDRRHQNETPVRAKALCVGGLVLLGLTAVAVLRTVASGAGATQTPLAVLCHGRRGLVRARGRIVVAGGPGGGASAERGDQGVPGAVGRTAGSIPELEVVPGRHPAQRTGNGDLAHLRQDVVRRRSPPPLPAHLAGPDLPHHPDDTRTPLQAGAGEGRPVAVLALQLPPLPGHPGRHS